MHFIYKVKNQCCQLRLYFWVLCHNHLILQITIHMCSKVGNVWMFHTKQNGYFLNVKHAELVTQQKDPHQKTLHLIPYFEIRMLRIFFFFFFLFFFFFWNIWIMSVKEWDARRCLFLKSSSISWYQVTSDFIKLSHSNKGRWTGQIFGTDTKMWVHLMKEKSCI